jgi:BirA family biotin operon repressor/biotin-[acetyl-CoA-carboxylase] ligase
VSAGGCGGSGRMTGSSATTTFPARLERLGVVGSTNDVVRDRLAAGEPEVCVAVAEEQTAGRGRLGRTWSAPAGSALLLSCGFRPAYVAPDRAWRLAAVVALAMADAAEEVAFLPEGAIRLKWPNDLVVAVDAAGTPILEPAALARGIGGARKLGGVLGETDGLGTGDPRAVVGIGLNAGWARADFPPALADGMTSLLDAAGGRPVDRELLLAAFLDRLETRVEALRGGRFDVAGWASRQLTHGHPVRLDLPDGTARTVRAVGVDGASGALLVEDPGAPGATRSVTVGEIVHLRLADAV